MRNLGSVEILYVVIVFLILLWLASGGVTTVQSLFTLR